MSAPTLQELPPPPTDKTGWPWTEEAAPLPETRLDPSASLRTGGLSWPRISIVTPSYNQGQFIEETIRSVLLQGYPNLEYFVIDGGSTDGTLEIIHKYEPWLTYWVSEPDEGQSDAINRGFARATGEILAWLNSDDTYLPGALHQAAETMAAYPSAAVVYGQSRFCDEQGRYVGTIGEPMEFRSLLVGHNMIPQPSAFVRRNAADRVGPLRVDLNYAMDLDYWLHLGLAGHWKFVEEYWSTYRRYPGAKTGQRTLAVDEEVAAVCRDFLSREDLPERVRRLKPTSGCHMHLMLARRCFYEHRPAPARRHIFLALQSDWHAITLRRWRGWLLRILLGPAWSRRLGLKTV